jgi:integrase
MFLYKRGNGVWYLYWKNGTKRQAVSCKTTRKEEALKFIRLFKMEKLRERPPDITLERFSEEFLKHLEQRLSLATQSQYHWVLKRFKEFIGDRLLKCVSIRDCEEYQASLVKEGLKFGSINEYFAKLHCAIETAITWNYVSDNWFSSVRRLKAQQRPPLYMKPDQIRKFLEGLPKFWRFLFTFALTTGCRASEIVNLRWEDVDLLRRTVQIGSKKFTTKTRRVRTIPMHDAIYSMLLERKKEAKSEFVFAKASNGRPYTPIHVSHVFKDTVRRLGLPEDLVLHSTRHTYASLLVASGVPIFSVSKLLGHSSLSNTLIYSHLSPENLSSEVQRLQIPS